MRLSYSAWKTWDQCPAKFKYSYIEKLPRTPPGDAAARGTVIHNSIDKFLARKVEELHPDINRHYGAWLLQLREYEPQPEIKFSVDQHWNPVPWSSDDVAWRGVIDLVFPFDEGDLAVECYEWKTGKEYSDHAYQSELYGIIALVREENAELAKVTNVYLDKRKNVPREYKREDLEGLKWLWDKKYDDVHNDKHHSPNPGWYCRYCDYGQASGGPCQF